MTKHPGPQERSATPKRPVGLHPLLALATSPFEGRSPIRRLIGILKRQAAAMSGAGRKGRSGLPPRPPLCGPLGRSLGARTKSVPKE